jgi:hypothetical protein
MPRPPKKLSDKDLAEIEMLAGLGLTQQEIAEIKDICVDTLRKRARKHWRRGKAKAIAKVAKTAFDMATSGKNHHMTKFYLQTQAGWREPAPGIPEELLKLLNLKGETDNGD